MARPQPSTTTQYVKGNFTYQANYRASLRIPRPDDLTAPSLNEIAYFDIYLVDDATEFNGVWSNYPYFDSGVVIVSGIEQVCSSCDHR